jgi:hypothetical protein
MDDNEKQLGQSNEELGKSVLATNDGSSNFNDTNAAVLSDWALNDPENPQTWSPSKNMYSTISWF